MDQPPNLDDVEDDDLDQLSMNIQGGWHSNVSLISVTYQPTNHPVFFILVLMMVLIRQL